MKVVFGKSARNNTVWWVEILESLSAPIKSESMCLVLMCGSYKTMSKQTTGGRSKQRRNKCALKRGRQRSTGQSAAQQSEHHIARYHSRSKNKKRYLFQKVVSSLSVRGNTFQPVKALATGNCSVLMSKW